MGVLSKLKNWFGAFHANQKGAFAIQLAVGAPLLILASAIVVEITDLHGGKTKSQDLADIAVLAAAKHIAVNIDGITSEAAFNTFKSEARKIGEAAIEHHSTQHNFKRLDPKFEFTTDSVSIELTVTKKAMMMSSFGYGDFPISVKATAVLPTSRPQDIDIVLITDATGSMATEIQAVQDNMRNLPVDLANELDGAGITVGSIRVKFIFYRDYIFDNMTVVTSRHDSPPSPLDGAMFESKFFELPGEVPTMETYIDQFGAFGGGDNPESGLEALVHAVDADEWGDGATTVRSVILWTDASTKGLHEFTPPDIGLEDGSWFLNLEWVDRIDASFAALDLAGRSQYMYDNFYPAAEIPTTMTDLQAKFESFHAQNANGAEDIVTFKINVSDICTNETGSGVCGHWAQLADWDGIEINHESATLTSTDTYWDTIRDIADAARTQIGVRDLAISN